MASNKKGEGDSSFHILVIRLSAMGDVAMIVPILYAISRQYPHVKITVLTKDLFKPMFSQIPNVAVFEADVKDRHKGVLGLWRLYREVKALNIDAVADLHHVLRSNILKQYFKTGKKLPFVQINKGRKEKKLLTTSKSNTLKPLRTTHERYADVFTQVGIPLDLSEERYLPKRPLSEKASKLVGAHKKKWLGIAPFAAFEGKMYPLALMEEVIDRLNASEKYTLLFFGGGKTERNQFEAWEDKYHNGINTAGQLKFKEELALISHLDLMLSMDSGNGHLAAMFGIPTVTLWGVTHPYAGFYPYGQDTNNALLSDREKFPKIPTSIYGNKMPQGYEKCMETITPEMVVSKIVGLLNAAK